MTRPLPSPARQLQRNPLATAFKVDVFVSKLRSFDRSSFVHREPAQAEGCQVWISSAEDTVLAKLDWYR